MSTTRAFVPKAFGSTKLLGGLLEQTPDLICFKDSQGRYLQVSASFARRVGIASPSEAIGRTAFDFFPAEVASQVQADDRRVLAAGEAVIGKREQMVDGDGREVWYSTTRLPLRDESGAVVGTIATSRDITARVRTETAFSEREGDVRLRGEAIERDLAQAWNVLKDLLPSRMPEHPRLEVKVHYSPMSSIGGDFISLPAFPGEAQGVFLGDLMGHGMAAAVHMALLKFLSDRLLVTFGTDPKGFLEHLNRQVRKQMRSTFVSGCYGLFQFRPGKPGATLTIAGAGHHGVLIQRAGDGASELRKLTGNAALGITDRYQTENMAIGLEPGDRVYLFTDGLPDTFDPESRALGMAALIDLFESGRGRSLQETINHVLAGVEAFRDGAPVSDDVVLAGFDVR